MPKNQLAVKPSADPTPGKGSAAAAAGGGVAVAGAGAGLGAVAGGAVGTGTSAAVMGAAAGEATATGLASAATTEGFLAGMAALTAETNHVQLVMGQLNLTKTLVEGFAKFIKEMGKGFVQQ
ncbi:MAG: hypothetical protein H7315_07690 [Herminiimonas sp.]|nr:hypothetical protein [Herminiimonas sp.]